MGLLTYPSQCTNCQDIVALQEVWVEADAQLLMGAIVSA